MNSSRIRLSRIIAFNWYGFRTIVEIDGLTLLCGETGTGKSALLDLIQFVLSAGTAKFNKAAAGENNARELVGYCLGHTNTRYRDGQPRYLRRSGATVAALEFVWPAVPGKKPRRETWGMRIQYDAPTSQPSFVRFFVPSRMERNDLCDDKGALLSEELFRYRVKNELGGDASFTTHKAFQEEMGVARHLHFDDEQMRRTLPKAIAFELATDYQRFIREFILEPNPPDVTHTQKSLVALREAETRVAQLYSQQQKLEQIEVEDQAYRHATREAALNGYLRHALNHAEAEETLAKTEGELSALRTQHQKDLKNRDQAVADRKIAQDNLDAVKLIAGKEDPQFSEFERLAREQKEHADALTALSGQAKTARKFLDERARAWEKWLRDAAMSEWPASVDAAKLSVLRLTETSLALEGIPLLVTEFHRIWRETEKGLGPIDSDIAEKLDKANRLEVRLKQLRDGRTATTPLLDKLLSLGIGAQTLGRVIEVRPEGEEWWGALESLLGDDRHATLVDTPIDFARAQELWLKLPKPEPLIDPSQIPQVPSAGGSLAECCETSHAAAQKYLNWRLGRLMPVRDRRELGSHPHGLATDGTLREGAWHRQLTPEKEFTLGEKGLRRLREAKEAEKKILLRDIQGLEQKRDRVRAWLVRGKEEHLDHDDRPDGSAVLYRIPELRAKKQQATEALKVVETPERTARLAKLNTLENAVKAADQKIGELKTPLSSFEMRQAALLDETNTATQELQNAAIILQEERVRLPADIPDADIEKYIFEAKNSIVSWKQRHIKAEGAEITWKTAASQAKERRFIARTGLLTEFADEFEEFDAKTDDNLKFDKRLVEIREHEVKKYHDLAEDRRADWEKRLQEDVLDRLRERVKDAQQTVSDFRRILNRPIGGYRYTLSQERDPVHAALWKLLAKSDDGFKAGDELLDHKLKDEIEVAKRALMAAVDNPEDKKIGAVLDYRNYHHYDFHMIPLGQADDSEGRISLQDRGRSLSGGEGQAPFFVAMLAAFYRVYDRRQRGQQSNLGLVVMDEAFSKLSAGHIADCLILAENFGLQLILAFPMDRLGAMVQHADSIIQCRVKRTTDEKGAPKEIINDVLRWQREEAIAEFLV